MSLNADQGVRITEAVSQKSKFQASLKNPLKDSHKTRREVEGPVLPVHTVQEGDVATENK